MKRYKCKNCYWQGTEDELLKELVESCMGNDEIEVCPECGSMYIVKLGLDSEGIKTKGCLKSKLLP